MRYRASLLSASIIIFGALLILLLSQTPGQTRTTTVTHTLTITEGEVEQACFSRVEECDSLLINLITQAKKSVYVAVYSFTRDSLSRALIDARNRGVDVKVVMERDHAFGQGSEYEYLLRNGVDVRLDSNPAIMHHKFMIVDGEVIATGSYNWSSAAEDRNDENIVVIRDRMLAGRFAQEFMRIWGEAERG